MAPDPSSSPPGPRAARRLFLATVALAAGWLGFGFAVLPWLIRRAWAGEGPGILNALIAGRAEHPVEVYLEAGRDLVLRGLPVIPAAAAGVYLLLRLRPRLALGWARFDTPRVRAGAALRVGIATGAVMGLMEAVAVFARQHVWELPPPDYHPGGALWLTPIVSAAVGGLLVLPWALARRRTPGGVGLRLPVVVLVALGLLAILDVARAGLHPVSQGLVVLGLGSVVARAAAARPDRFVAGARRVAWVLPLLALVGGVGGQAWRAGAERAAVANLDAPPARAPNVLIVVWDAVRARNLSLYGYPRATSPRLDELAARGVTFERAMAPSSWSLPSHGTLLTGRHPHRLGVNWTDALDDRWPTLAETLADRGYRTAGFSGNRYYASRASGIGRGFARYDDAEFSPVTAASTSWFVRTPARYVMAWLGDHRDPTQWRAENINASLLDWLDQESERPFFAFLNYFDAHDPYRPPAPYDTVFVEPDARYWVGYDLSEEEFAELEDAYDGSITYLDHALEELVTELEARGLLEETLLVVTSDHGEQFGEIGPSALTHGYALYDWLLHIPLVMVYPDRLPPGVRVPAVVGLRDVPATILDLAGVDPPPLPGVSLRGLWEGREIRPSPALSWTAPGTWTPPEAPVAKGPMFSVREGDLHYILEGDGAERLYDVSRDPWERVDLAPDPEYAEALESLRAAVDSLTPGG